MNSVLLHSAVVGTVGAVSVLGFDSVIVHLSNAHHMPLGRPLARMGLAAATAGLAHVAHAPEPVVEGIVVGTVVATVWDLAIAVMQRSRKPIEPPPAPTVAVSGLPWAPRPYYVIG